MNEASTGRHCIHRRHQQEDRQSFTDRYRHNQCSQCWLVIQVEPMVVVHIALLYNRALASELISNYQAKPSFLSDPSNW